METENKKSSSKSKGKNMKLEEKINNLIILIKQIEKEFEKTLEDKSFLACEIRDEYKTRKIKNEEYKGKDHIILITTDKGGVEIRVEDYKDKKGILVYKDGLMLYGAIFNKDEELLISSAFEEITNSLIYWITISAEKLASKRAEEYLKQKYEIEIKELEEKGLDYAYESEIKEHGKTTEFYRAIYVYDNNLNKYLPRYMVKYGLETDHEDWFVIKYDFRDFK